MAADKDKIAMPGKSTVTINSTALGLSDSVVGHTDEYAAQLGFDTAFIDIKTHNSGEIPIGSIANGTRVMVDLKLVEIDHPDVPKLAFPFATHYTNKFKLAGSQTVGVLAKVIDTIRVHLDSDGDAETHDWLLNKLDIKNESIKIRAKIGEKWILDIKAECEYNDAIDMVTYGVPVA